MRPDGYPFHLDLGGDIGGQLANEVGVGYKMTPFRDAVGRFRVQ
jgi:hypothetical protein